MTRPVNRTRKGEVVAVFRARTRDEWGAWEIAQVLKTRQNGLATHFALGNQYEPANKFPDAIHGKANTTNDRKALRIMQVAVLPARYHDAATKLAGYRYDQTELLREAIKAAARDDLCPHIGDDGMPCLNVTSDRGAHGPHYCDLHQPHSQRLQPNTLTRYGWSR